MNEFNNIIDVHGHFGLYSNNNGDLNDQLMSGNLNTVSKRATLNNIEMTLVSSLRSLMPYGGDVVAGNNLARMQTSEYANIKFWAVYNPKDRLSEGQKENS